MLRIYSLLLFSLAFGSSFLLTIIPLPAPLVGFAVASVTASIALANLMLIRTTGAAIGIAGLLLVFQSAPIHTPTLAGLLAFQGAMLLSATCLLIAADLSAVKEKQLCDL